MPDPTTTSQTDTPRPSPNALQILIAACVSGFLFQFDLTALSAALPDIASNLSARIEDQAWIINIYSLSLIFALPLAGPIADRYGRRRVFVSGALLFALASALCATAATLVSLLAWRALQGIAGAALTASAAALLAAAYLGPRRAWASAFSGQWSARLWSQGRRSARSSRRRLVGRGCSGSTFRSALPWCC